MNMESMEQKYLDCATRLEAAEADIRELLGALRYLSISTAPDGQWADQAVKGFVDAILAKHQENFASQRIEVKP